MKVAAVQLAPAYLDREGTIDVVLTAMAEAATNGARLVAFPETFVAGYPSWADFSHASAFDVSEQKAAFRWYVESAVDIEGGDLDRVVAASAEFDQFVYLGVVERSDSGASVYCSLVAIDPTGGIVGVHRKLKPTYGERLMWADGDGHGLRAHAFDGIKVSGLNCWENWMPLARAAMYAQGPSIHVSGWGRRRSCTTTPASSPRRDACSWWRPVRSCGPSTSPTSSR